MTGDMSVVMPLHNGAPWVAEAITSVLEHADGLLELIVVDDGSTDDGPYIARSFGDPVRVVAQEQQGCSGARNRGLLETSGALIGFLDADDLWVAGIPDPRRAVLADPEVEVVLGRVQPVFGDPAQPLGETMGGIQLGAMLARREAILGRHGGMDSSYWWADDLDLILRMRDAGTRVELIEDVTVWYRQRAGQLTQDRAGTHTDMVRALHKSIQRKQRQ